MDIPVKLIVVFLVLSISFPMIMNAVDRNEEVTAVNEMEYEFTRFADAVTSVHYSGEGSMRSVTLDVPEGCTVQIGGEGADAYSIRGRYHDGNDTVRYMEVPPIMFVSELHLMDGEHVITVTSVTYNGKAAVAVMRI